MSRCKKAGQKHSIKIVNRSFEDVAKLTYLGTITDQNFMHKEFKRRLNSGYASYHSIQSLLSSRFLSGNVKVKIYNTIILPVNPEEKRPLGRPRRRWEDGIRMDLRDIV
jgi:hypothetical protein